MSLLCQQPHVVVYQDGSSTLLPLTAWESLNHALDTNEEWWEGKTLHGADWRVRTETIADIGRMTQPVLDLLKREREEAEEEERARRQRWDPDAE